MRDGGTIMLYNKGTKQKPFYIHKDNFTLHDDFPTNEENLITDKSMQVYILDRLQQYKINREIDLNQVKNIIKKIKL
jgi:CMP-N-acetylneuraminic acid synthetase